MRHAYLIMAYSDFYILQKLIKAIDNPDGDIFLHLDAKNKYLREDIKKLSESVKYSHLTVYSQIPVIWGDKSLVECELLLMNQAAVGNYAYYHLLSGQDFLLKPVRKVQQFFEKNNGKEFLAVDTNPLNRDLMIDRIDQYHWIFNNRRLTINFDRLSRPVEKCFGIHRLNKEKFACFAKGMQWASITNSFVKCILQEQEKVLRMASHALCFDEMYKQMIYMAHRNEFQLYKEINLSEENLRIPRYRLEVAATMHKVDWERGMPYTYRTTDYNELINSPCCFARKFNSSVDRNIIDKLYEYVVEK